MTNSLPQWATNGELIAYLSIDANSSCTNKTKPETPRCQQNSNVNKKTLQENFNIKPKIDKLKLKKRG